ncbi:hypothetical protein M8375_36135, partial [Klebsiella pneumoniae]|nr:hypothetical protein [Klebsiella pneumoniae]
MSKTIATENAPAAIGPYVPGFSLFPLLLPSFPLPFPPPPFSFPSPFPSPSL